MGSGRRRRGAAAKWVLGRITEAFEARTWVEKSVLEIPEEPFAFYLSSLSLPFLASCLKGSGRVLGFYLWKKTLKLTHPASVSPEIGGNKGQSWRWSIGENLW